jgi:hypothetical protein
METDHDILTLASCNSFEKNLITLAEYHNENTKPGMGFFFDFSKTPELGKELLDYLVKGYGWAFDHENTFIRKPRIKPHQPKPAGIFIV